MVLANQFNNGGYLCHIIWERIKRARRAFQKSSVRVNKVNINEKQNWVPLVSEFHPIVQVLKNSYQNPVHYYLIQNNFGLCSFPAWHFLHNVDLYPLSGCYLIHGQKRQSCCWTHWSMGIDDVVNSFLHESDISLVEKYRVNVRKDTLETILLSRNQIQDTRVAVK